MSESKKGLSALVSSEGTGKDHPLWKAMGGFLGVIETLLPGMVFVLVLGLSRNPWLSIWVSVGISIAFTIYRIVRRQPVTQALVGLLGVVASAVLATMSNRPEDNFVVGLLTNAVYGSVFLLSILIGWPIIGIAVGFFKGEGTAWRKNKHHFRVFQAVTAVWVGMFALRILVEYPLYLQGNIEALSMTKLLLGLPLYVPVLAITWLVIRSLYREKTVSETDASSATSL